MFASFLSGRGANWIRKIARDRNVRRLWNNGSYFSHDALTIFTWVMVKWPCSVLSFFM